MADNEDDNNSASKSAAAKMENLDASGPLPQPETTQAEGENNQDDASKTPSTAEGGVDQGLAELMHSESAVDVRVVDGTQEVIGQIVGGEVITDPNIITSYVQVAAEAGVTAECTTVSGEVLNALAPTTTIIYVQPDGSFVESSGLSAEEQQQLIEQLAKQHLVHVAGTDTVVKPSTSPIVDVQQVIVSKAQVIAQTEPATTHTTTPKILQRAVTSHPTSYITLESSNLQLATAIQPQPVSIVQNASQQLQSVAKQVALQQSQNGANTTTQKTAEPIQIQVQAPLKQDSKQRQTTPITILQSQNLSAGQPLVKVSTVGTLSSPQIIHITPVPGQQQYFLQNPSDPPIQLLLQKPSPVVSTISVPISKVHVPAPATVKSPPAKPVVPTPKVLVPSPKVLSPPAKITMPTKVITAETKTSTPTAEKDTQKVKNRQKKPQKIQTRSGRVSRPPKHKVKDYKFIKNEDLAESHQSDSDDYSEISVEDEDGEEHRKKSSDVTLNLRDKSFKCDTCDKAYIGVAGLNRHYKLNPTHDKNPTPPQAEDLSKTRDEQPSGTEVTDTSHVKTLSTQKVQEIGKVEIRRPGRPRGPGRPGRPRRPGRPPKRGRPGRPPKYPGGMSLEQQAQRQRNRLKEFIKQYDDEDLMEIVLPRLARVMTLWEFVLMKVEKGYPSKQQFPSVYHEFEQLHSQVKKMALEYLHTSPASRPAIEVNNMGVLQSLGITDPNALKLLTSSEGQQSQKTNQSEPRANQGTKSLRTFENAKMLPPAKRFKIENCNEETNGYQVNQNGIQKDETVDGSVLRKPQVVLTRLENLTSVDLTAEDATESAENASPPRTEEEPMETEVPSSDSDATKTVEDPDISKVLNSSVAVDIADQMKQLEQALSTDSEFKNSQEPAQQEVQEGQADTLEDLEASQVVQEESPVVIQTAEGLVMQSAEELAAKGIVIVNGPDGTMMHIEAPEGVPLETVHALLGIETERKT
ncbi:Zinc finger protein 839 [Anabarilius grahami]|uniref:Zinc finger protein 839 n=1 Tax=Anabarilius grahami TaxID=495550 RepID=A0A3N0YFD7_ANAGA|nr:Zinc finger protein 839 [Anabarilius grahami]